ncbi:hypothetical protein BX600DRAFT_505012 [Xylariales sp. PMI_506]|nr:hypothetical protein BX600DRAFT_505012 [Xylariales sp. PMI_506]
MPVTELAFFPLSSRSTGTDLALPADLHEIMGAVLQVQDDWCTSNLGSGSSDAHSRYGAGARGAAFFRRVDDPSALLLTAHWSSVAEHRVWIASEANQAVAFASLKPFVDLQRAEMFHVEGVSAFPDAADAGVVPTIRAPVVEVSRFTMPLAHKDEFNSVIATVISKLHGFALPHIHRGGWKIEKTDGSDDVAEYILIGGWPDVSTAKEFGDASDGRKFESAFQGLITGWDRQFFVKIQL